ncbi:DUF2510 domain-containing protein [Mycobacterium paraterrae]|uniref:DUF2510 domain-containing protein n=1 Tax=Mycobacterium paraterrae TaxID=577492 RepID=UPI0033140533
MLSGLLNTLVWILILVVIIAVILAVVRAVGSPRSSTVVEQPVARQAPPVSGGLTPGWYPDQNDPNLLRYYDGRVWTAQTEPRA